MGAMAYRAADRLFSVLLLAAAGVLFWMALEIAGNGGLFPRIITGATVLLALGNLVLSLRESGAARSGDPVSLREFLAMSWPVALTVVIYLIGFYAGAPIFILGFILLRRNVSLIVALLATAAFWVLMYVMFAFVLKIELFPGILFSG